MSDSRRDREAVAASPQLSGERLAELLSAISEAPDFSTGATFMIAQIADILGARRAIAITLDSPPRRFVGTASIGFDDAPPPPISLSTDDLSNPIVVAALSLYPVSCDGAAPLPGIPFGEWTAIPFPQPQYRGAPHMLSDAELDLVQLNGCLLRRRSAAERRRRYGHAPGGVALIEASVDDETLIAVMHATSLAGPVLARMAAVEEFRLSTGRLDQQREMLTAIVNSLPDPIVIINAEHDIVVQNKRAEHLLFITEDDSPGRRRAVEVNNLLFSSFLSRATIAGTPSGGARELNLVDPDEGHDLLFEVLTHPLGERVGPEDSVLSVLRDVTDLRRDEGQ